MNIEKSAFSADLIKHPNEDTLYQTVLEQQNRFNHLANKTQDTNIMKYPI